MKQKKFRRMTDQRYYDAFAEIWGWGVPKKPENGKRLLNKLITEDKKPKNSLLRYHLGLAYLNGFMGWEEKELRALEWFCQSSNDLCVNGWRAKRLLLKQIREEAKKGDKIAQYYLAVYWNWHRIIGRRRRDRWLRKSIHQKYLPADELWRRTHDIIGPTKNEFNAGIENLSMLSNKTLRKVAELGEKIDSRYIETLEKVTALGDKFDILNEDQRALHKEVQAFFADMEERVIDIARETPEATWKKHEKKLSDIFREGWSNGQLHDNSKESLISAYVLLEYAEEQKLGDFRGIVISVTSVLERELKARFCDGFRTYLEEQGCEIPCSLKKTFTLGSFFYIICNDIYKREMDGTTSRTPKSDDELKQIDDYLETIVTEGKKQTADDRYSDIFIKYGGNNSFSSRVKKVLNKYRNPAAHTEASTHKSAKNCVDFVVAGSEIENVVGLLYELLQLTQPYKYDR